ncbi:hypothetical protein NFI96_000504 [Prochilodus magdalenae]|nr:hypothetical protein NFI96_000504 [Prochilodus magdalenae]
MAGITLFILFLPAGLSLKQSPDLFANEGENVTLKCAQISTTYNGMYWFRQRPDAPLEHIVYYYVNIEKLEDKFKDKVSAVRTGASLDLGEDTAEHRQRCLLLCKAGCTASLVATYQVDQSPPDILKKHTQSAKLSCSHSVREFEHMLWFKQSEDGNFKYLGYLNLKNAYPEKEYEDKIHLEGNGNSAATLTINNLTAHDSAVYFCAARRHSISSSIIPAQKHTAQ